MVLADSVVNSYGQTLIGAGLTLSQKHIFMLKTWNVLKVRVKSENEEENEEIISTDVKVRSEQWLKNRIKWKPDNKFEQDIYQMGILNRAKQMMKNGVNE